MEQIIDNILEMLKQEKIMHLSRYDYYTDLYELNNIRIEYLFRIYIGQKECALEYTIPSFPRDFIVSN